MSVSELAILNHLETELTTWHRVALADSAFGVDHPAYPVAGVLGHLRDLPAEPRLMRGCRQVVTQEYGVYVACLRAEDEGDEDPIADARSDLLGALMGYRFAGSASTVRYLGCTMEHVDAQAVVHLYRFAIEVEYTGYDESFSS